MNTDELHNRLAEKGWLIDDLTEVDFLLIAHVKEIMEKQLRIGCVSNRFSEPEKMAEWLHNNYEEIALNNG